MTDAQGYQPVQAGLAAQIDVETLARWRADGQDHVVLDVREDWEYALCRLPDGIHVPLGRLAAVAEGLPRDRTLVVVCHHGVRSAWAVQWLHRQGFDRAVNLAGGIDAWALCIDPSMEVY